MSQNLYFKTNQFSSNKELAQFFHEKLKNEGVNVEPPDDEGYMFVIESTIDGEAVTFYLGKNDEESTPPLWQAWPEQSISLIKRIFGKPNRNPEELAKKILEKIVNSIEGVTNVEWDI